MLQKARLPKTVFISLIAALLAKPIAAQSVDSSLRDLSKHSVDEAQLRTAVASRTLTWLTGTSTNNDYISVGRLANYFGFVALRVSSGQSLTRAHVARDTLATLEDEQINVLVSLLEDQAPAHERTQSARIAMNRALERIRVGEDVIEDEFLALGRTYGAAEAEFGRVLAQSFGEIAGTLTSEQKEQLMVIRTAHASGQPELIPRTKSRTTLPQVDRQDLVNLAARLLSWTTGSQDFNDFEVVGKPSQHFGFVSLRLASGHAVRRGAVAREVLELLSSEQRQMLDLAVKQNSALFNAFLVERAKLMRELEVALAGQVIDQSAVQTLGASVGEIEARMTWAQAKAMLSVRDTLTAKQRDALLQMRAAYTVAETQTASRDPIEHGRMLFAQCVMCHAASRAESVAPNLTGIIGRTIAADSDYESYSPALQSFGQSHERWNQNLLDAFLKSPRALVPGTTMGFDGFDSAQDRAALIAYIAAQS